MEGLGFRGAFRVWEPFGVRDVAASLELSFLQARVLGFMIPNCFLRFSPKSFKAV